MNMFSRAAHNLNLTPGERAFLKLLKGWLYTAIAAAIAIGVQYVYSNQVIDWQKLSYLIGGAILLSFLTALEKYFTAQGDAPLAIADEVTKEKSDQNLPQGKAQAVAASAQRPLA
jgi:hypothetical protein